MPEYTIKHDKDFIARVSAENADDAFRLLLNIAGKQEEAPANAELGWCNQATFDAYFQTAPDNVQAIRADLSIAEKIGQESLNLMDGNCAYCGKNPAEVPDGDHVIARGFFETAKRINSVVYIRVPVCHQCNGKKAGLEQDVMGFFQAAIDAKHPDLATIFAPGGTMERSIRGGHRPWPSILRNAEPMWVLWDENGLWMPTASVKPDPALISEYIEFVIRGLYFWHFKKSLPENIAVYACQTKSADWLRGFEMMKAAPSVIGPHDLGDGVFRYATAKEDHWPVPQIWAFSFYNDAFPFTAFCLNERKPNEILRLTNKTDPDDSVEYVLVSQTKAEAVIRRIVREGDTTTASTPITVPRVKLALMEPTKQSLKEPNGV